VVAQGLSNSQIARQLRIAEGTVKVHLSRIFEKLEIANRTELDASKNLASGRGSCFPFGRWDEGLGCAVRPGSSTWTSA
jgi:Bacterial regulatory proteins, luxR family